MTSAARPGSDIELVGWPPSITASQTPLNSAKACPSSRSSANSHSYSCVLGLSQRLRHGCRRIVDQRSAGPVGSHGKACGGVLAEQSEIGRVCTVTHRQSSAGVVAVGHIAKYRIAAESKICKLKQVVTVEACHGATEIGGMVDLQRGVGAGIERDVLAERPTHFESRHTVDQHRACAAHIAVGRDVGPICPQQSGIGYITIDNEAATTSRS